MNEIVLDVQDGLPEETGASQALSPTKQALLKIRTLQAELQQYRARRHEPLAIIGIGCRFPGDVASLDDFWRLLRAGGDATGAIPSDRWSVETSYSDDPDAPGAISTRRGAFLKDIDRFDPGFFGIAPKEAAYMDPKQRLLLECGWEALEGAGYSQRSIAGSRTGVFIGTSDAEYLAGASLESLNEYTGVGNAASVAAGRLAYTLGVNGPALVVDTACSSSLVAVHLACESLRRGESDMALAGAVGLYFSPGGFIVASRARMLSRDGRCKTFDERADGYVRGEGCAVLALKRLADAQAAGDRVLALVRGSAINQDGASGGLTVPSGLAQEAVIRRALENAQAAASQVQYVEAHGTGTPLGDPIEVGALAQVYGAGRSAQQPLLIGSVKTNVGHLEAAAGMAGLVKVVLALQHELIPRHLHCEQPSSHIPWRQWPIEVTRAPTAWPRGERRRLAGVSSFGFSGTNAHVIVEEAPLRHREPASVERPRHVLTVSARSAAALEEMVGRYRGALRGMSAAQTDAGDVCFTANAGRNHFRHRVAVSGATLEELEQGLSRAQGRESGVGAPKLAWLFSDRDSRWACRALYAGNGYYRQQLDECARLLQGELDQPLPALLWGDAQEQTQYAALLLFVQQVTLGRLWQSWGVRPDVVLGQGAGEYAAACLSGVFSLEDGLKLARAHGLPAQFEAVAQGVRYDKPRQGYVSGVSGEAAYEAVAEAGYWVRRARQAPRHREGLQTLKAQGVRHCLEIGAGTQPPGLDDVAWQASLEAGQPAWTALLQALGALYEDGVEIDWQGFDQPYARWRVALPTYAFQRQRYWMPQEPAPERAADHPLLGRRFDAAESASTYFSARIAADAPAYLKDHVLFGAVLVPGAGYVEMALAAAIDIRGAGPVALAGVEFAQALTLNDADRVETQFVLAAAEQGQRRFRILARHDAGWALHATGLLLDAVPAAAAQQVDVSRLAARCAQTMDGAAFYAEMERSGVIFGPAFGPAFRRIRCCRIGQGEAVSEISTPADAGCYALHPTVLDACFQTIMTLLDVDADYLCIPGGVGSLRFYGAASGPLWCHAVSMASGVAETAAAQRVLGDMRLFDAQGRLVAELTGFKVLRLERSRLLGSAPQSWRRWLYTLAWQPDERGVAATMLAAPPAIHEALRPELARLVAPPLRRRQSEIVERLEALSLAYILLAFDRLGWNGAPGATFSVHRLADEWDVDIQHRRLFLRLFQILVEAGVAAREADHWRVIARPQPVDIAATLAAMRQRHPEVTPELAMLERCGSRLADVLTGRCDALELLFGGGAELDKVYASSPLNQLAARALAVAAAAVPAGAPLRVLEVGAGTGGTTRSVLQALSGATLEYTFTDVSPVFLAQAQGEFADIAGLQYRTLNIEESPEAQGFEAQRYDIVLAANVLHATRDLRRTLLNVSRLLAPGGILALFEATRRLRLADLVFGLTEGWWRFTDLAVRPDHPLLTAGQWRDLLSAGGFEDARAMPEADGNDGGLTVIVARKPEAAAAAPSGVGWLVLDDEQGDGALLAAYLGGQGWAPLLVQPPSMAAAAAAERLDLADASAVRRFIAGLAAEQALPQRIVYFASGAIARDPAKVETEMARTCMAACLPLLHLVQALLHVQHRAALTVVTRGAVQAGPDGAPVEPVQAAVWGLAGTVAAEQPELSVRRIDLDLAQPCDPARLCQEAGSASRDDQVALRGARRYVARLARHDIASAAGAPLVCRRDGSYLITGGLGGLGLRVAGMLAERGAGALVLLGRSRPAAAALAQIERLRALGVEVRIVQASVADAPALTALFERIAGDGPPLRGIVHAAGVLRDGLLARQSASAFTEVFQAKAAGAWHLHRLSQACSLDFFVLFSSASGLLGAPGQAPHAAANWFMDTLSQLRRRQGLPSTSIAWGPWSDVGAASSEKVQAHMRRFGMGMIDPASGLAAAEHFIMHPAAQVAVMPIDMRELAARFPLGQGPALFSRLSPFFGDDARAGGVTAEADLMAALRAAPASQRRALLADFMLQRIAFVLGIDAAALDAGVALTSLGLDSLMALKLRTIIDQTLQLDMPVSHFLTGMSAGELADWLWQRLAPQIDDQSAAGQAQPALAWTEGVI